MRLLLLILLLWSPALVHGQAFWFGARGGVLFNNAPSAVRDNYFKNAEGGTGWLAGATAAVEIKPWLQLGLGFDRLVRNYSYESPLRFQSPEGIYNHRYEVNSRAVSGYVFANYRHLMKRSFAYAGLQFGDFQVMNESITAFHSTEPNNGVFSGSSGTSPGAFFGGQLGYSRQVKGNWYVQAEVAARYRPKATMYVVTETASDEPNYVRRNTSFIYYPVSLSVNYRLNTARHKPVVIPKAEIPDEEPETEEEE